MAAAADNKALEAVAVDLINFLARCGPRNQWDKYFAYFNDHFEGIQEPSPPEGLKPFASLWNIYKQGVQRSPAHSPVLRRAPARVQLSLAPSIPLLPTPAAGAQHQHHPPVQPHRQTRRGQWPQVGTSTRATGTAAGGQQHQHQQQDQRQVTEEEQQQPGGEGAGPSSSKRPRPAEDQALIQYLIQKVDTVQDTVNRLEASTGGTLLHGGAVRFPKNTQGMMYQLPTLLPYTGDVYQPHELEQCRRAALVNGLTIFQLPQLAIDMAAVVAASILITRVYNHMVFSSVNANSKTQYGTGQRVQVVLAKSDKNSSGDLDTTLTLLTDKYNAAVYSALTAEKKKEVDEAKKVLALYLTLLQPVLRQLLGRPLNALATIITDPTWQRRLNRTGKLVTTPAEQLAQAQAPHTDFLPVGPGMDDGLVFLLALQDFPLVAYMGSHKLSQLAAAHCCRTADGKKQVVEVKDMDALALTLPHQLGTEVLVKAGQLVLFRGNTVHAGNVGVAGSCCARLYGFGRPDTVADNTTMNTSELGDLYHGLFQPIQDEGIGPKMADWNRRGMAGQWDPVDQDSAVWSQDPVVRDQDPVVPEPCGPCSRAAEPCRRGSQDPVGVRQNPDPVMWYQDPVGQDPVVWCQDPVDPVCQNPVVRCQDPVGVQQDPVVRHQDPVVPEPCASPRSPGHMGLLGKALLKGAVLASKGKLAARKLRDATARGVAAAGQWVGGEPSASSPSLDPMDAEAAAPTASCRTEELGPSSGLGTRLGTVRVGPGELQGSQPPRWLDTAARAPPRPSPDDRRARREERQRVAQCRSRRGNTQPATQPARGGPSRRRYGIPSSGSSSEEWEARREGHQQAGRQRAAQLGHGSPHVRRYGLLSPSVSLASSLGASCDSPVVEPAGPREGRLRVPKRQQPEQAAQPGEEVEQLGPLPLRPPLAIYSRVAAKFLAVTLNVQGLAQPHKLQALLDWAADSPAQVVFLQECHRAESVWQWAEAHSGAKPAWRGQWFYTPGTGSSQGCLVLVKPSTILRGCTQVQLQAEGAQGRVLRVDGELAGMPVSLVCVYAPAQQAERPAFHA
ncbi:hypothetical protein QJQ45_007506, partial [Haematococcus lacustris]